MKIRVIIMCAAALLIGQASVLPQANGQDSEAPAQAQATSEIDATLFDIPEGQTASFYQDRLQKLREAVSAIYTQDQNNPKLGEILEKYNAAVVKITKALAYAEDADENLRMSSFQSFTLMQARDGKLEELKTIYAQESSKENNQKRVVWMEYLITVVSLDLACQAGDEGAIKEQLDAIVAKLPDDEQVAAHIEEYLQLVSMVNDKLSAEYTDMTLGILKNSDKPYYQQLAKRMEGKARFAKLVGNEMLVEGVYLDKTPIDWKAYRGKVVLVDFWATWCGPCLGEIPNVLALYQKYHEAGFDVLGYSLDDDLDALEQFEEKRQLPWKTASRKLSLEEKKSDDSAYTDLTSYYGVNAIPTMVLVGRDGKVIDTHARGEHLKELLEKEFPEEKAE
ncbi:MAG: TlpA disulfide reductase family protein [Planctomycetia bacterium]|nr:TlpA disulfide reductase family protein [Planctomycetia bacterium]